MKPTPAPNATAIEYAANERAPVPTPSGRKGGGLPERRNGHRPKRLMKELDGGVVRTKGAVRLAHKPTDSMNPTSGKADLFAFRTRTLAIIAAVESSGGGEC